MAVYALAMTCVSAGAQTAPQPYVAASIPPLQFILEEILGEGRAKSVLPPGASAHVYDPRVSDARMTYDSRALFVIGPGFDDWARDLPAPQYVNTITFLPDLMRGPNPPVVHVVRYGTTHQHYNGPDPHFWADPIMVQQLTPRFVEALVKVFPEEEEAIYMRGQMFQSSLTKLDANLNRVFSKQRGKRVVLGHTSWRAFFDRYGLDTVDVLEVTPGREISYGAFADLATRVEKEDIDVIVIEPGHGERAARLLHEETGAPIVEINPVWGGSGDYESLVLENAFAIFEALK